MSLTPAVSSKRRARRATRDFTDEEWLDLLLRADFRCAYCGCHLPANQATVDHATPLSRGGSNNILNILPACSDCNTRKGRRTAEEFVGRDTAKRLRKRLHRKEPREATILRRTLYALCVAYTHGESGSGEALSAFLRASGVRLEDANRTLAGVQHAATHEPTNQKGTTHEPLRPL